ncbi:DNA ligase D [Methylovorus menthalis]|uniref:DNA ligase D n=1 Tax=Methylovorus menthalis TaxID=1002227 RepID=UPI001E3F5A31|nr:DNA ligase D [Methylovorus menthalis]MCB4809818.1 DNA ligase D [Methylovorus menthalis]
MGLNHYWQKRNFNITPEPAGTVASAGDTLAFYIQRHHARRLHYDFRLELDGVLKSWAIPKGPTLDPKEKRLAVHVEDHPLEYGHFEGQIPEHQYGAGRVVLWDCGTWEPLEEPHAGYQKGALKFMLHGEKLSGKWALVRMGKKPAEGSSEKENWLLIKEKDDVAQSGDDANITETRPESIRNLFSGDAHRPLQSPDRKSMTGATSTTRARKSTKTEEIRQEDIVQSSGKPEPMPTTMQPQLALLAKKAPLGEDWLTEVKFDGYRMLARREQGKVRLYSRNGHDWTAKWKGIADALKQLPVDQAWLDGELVALQADGKVSFQALQDAMQTNSAATLAYFIFDLMYLNGHDLRRLPLIKRKALLKTLLAHSAEDGPLHYSDHIAGNAPEVFDHACLHDLEGVIAKRADAPYQPRRSDDWLKVKCGLRQEFVIGGYTDPAGNRQGFGALLLGVYDADGALHYAGRVGTGFTETTLTQLSRQFGRLQRASSPFRGKLTGLQMRGVHWLTPKLVAEVRFAQWTDSQIVRHAAFVGVRQDKPARDIVHETSVTPPLPSANTASATEPPRPKSPQRGASERDIAGVRLTHPGKILFAQAQLSKQDLAHYYEEIAPWILPQLQGRPLSLVRCPTGAGQQCFFQKHAAMTIPDNVRRIQVPVSGFSDDYMVVDDLPALISLVQMGVLEIHTWGSREGHLEQPDRIIFDLDPDETLKWTTVVESAQLVRALLQALGLESFAKTTGGKGIHVVIPIVPEHSWKTIKAFSKATAQYLEKQLPDRFTANMSKEKRTGKVFIDYLRNAPGATAIAAYSSRAKPTATVSVPISWDELNMGIRSDTFTVATLPERLAQLKQDPWQDYERLRQHITTAMLEMFT